MRLGKKILGLFAGIMCLGALASCTKGGSETTPTKEEPAIEKVYVSHSCGDNESPEWKEYTLENLNSCKLTNTKLIGGGIVISFQAKKELKVKSISVSFNNILNSENITNVSATSRIYTSKDSHRSFFNDYTSQQHISLTEDTKISLNDTVEQGKYYNFLIYKGGEWSNVRIDYEEVK